MLWDAVRASVEPLERRALLSATITVGDINAAETSHSVSVTYNDPDGVDLATIDGNDLNVSGPKPVAVSLVSATPVSGDPTTVNAVYALAGPGGSWDAGDSGGYGITIPVDQVKDSLGNNLITQPEAANFDVSFPPPPDTTGPDVSISVDDITKAGGTSHTFTVVYTDPSGINESSIDTGDFVITWVGTGIEPPIVTGVKVSGSGTSRTAVYTISAEGVAWDFSDNGTYQISNTGNAVQDASPNANSTALTDKPFKVNIPEPPDAAPQGQITAPTISSATGATTISVLYTDDRGIRLNTIGAGNIQVTRGGDSLNITETFIRSQSLDRKSALVVYSVIGPGGSFDAADYGEFTVSRGNSPV
jgi:hypothetical protein